MELIGKSKLLEELKRCEKICEDYTSSHKDAVSQGIANAKRAVCQHFIKFLDTLEVKETDLDFQTFAKEMETVFALPSSKTKNTEENSLNWEYAIARHFFELGMKTKKGE